MKDVFRIRKSVLPVMAVILMVLLTACESTPASPTPVPVSSPTTAPVAAATATTAQAPAATSTTAQTTGGQATPATGGKGKLAMAPSGTIKQAGKPAPKGDLAARSLTVAQSGTSFENAEPARATVTRAVPEPTATDEPPAPSSDVPEDWAVVLDSDFSTGDPGTWLIGEAGNISANVDNGTYNMVVSDGSGFYSWSDETSNWTDGYVSATFTIDGPGSVGISARVGKASGKFTDIVCVISNAGKYGCYREVDGQNTTVGRASSSAIKKNGENTVALLGIGSDFTFFINGTSVKTFDAGDVAEGAWGAYIETGPGTTTTGAYSHIVFMGPGEAIESTPTPEPNIEETATPEEAQPTDTPVVEEATETPTTEAAPPENVTPTAAAENVIVSTDFADGAGTWLTGQGDGYLVDVTDGELTVQSDNANGVVATAPEEAMDVADARIEATLRIDDTSTTDHGLAGVSARSQEFASGFKDWAQIYCGINNTGAYSCNRLTTASDGTISFSEVLHGKTSKISKTKPNTIALTAKGTRWTFEVNGTKVGSFTDNSFKSGAWGVLVRSGDAGITGYYSKVSVFKP